MRAHPAIPARALSTALLSALAAVAACVPVTPKVEDASGTVGVNLDGGDGADGTDGGADGTDGTDGGTDGTDGGTDGTDGSTDGTDGGTDGTDGTDGTEEPPYPLTWEGTRVIEFPGYCEEELVEVGIEFTQERDAEPLLDACPGCEMIFFVEVSPDTICGSAPVAPEVIRGIEPLSGNNVIIYAFGQDERGDWVAYELSEGELDGELLTYAYEGELSGYDYTVDGEAVLAP